MATIDLFGIYNIMLVVSCRSNDNTITTWMIWLAIFLSFFFFISNIEYTIPHNMYLSLCSMLLKYSLFLPLPSYFFCPCTDVWILEEIKKKCLMTNDHFCTHKHTHREREKQTHSMKKQLLTDNSSLSVENKNDSQLLLLLLSSSLLLSVAPVTSNSADNDSNLLSLGGD